MMITRNELIATFLSVSIVSIIIATLWYLLWVYVIKVNPLIIELFDLNKKTKENTIKQQ